MQDVLQQLKHTLIVSCQAQPDEPLYVENGGIMVLMAKAALEGGASAIRTESITDVSQIKAAFPDVSVIGLVKIDYPNFETYITPTMKEVDELVEAGADIIAMDATFEPRGDNQTINEFFQTVREKYPKQLFMADVATLEEGINASKLGFDIVGTTMSGYTKSTAHKDVSAPDFELIKALKAAIDTFVIAEARIQTAEDLMKALEAGADAVVVGGAITRPKGITERFMTGLNQWKEKGNENESL